MEVIKQEDKTKSKLQCATVNQFMSVSLHGLVILSSVATFDVMPLRARLTGSSGKQKRYFDIKKYFEYSLF